MAYGMANVSIAPELLLGKFTASRCNVTRDLHNHNHIRFYFILHLYQFHICR